MTDAGGFPRLAQPVGPHDHAQGPEDAPVTLVMYGDYECPYTAAAHVFVQSMRESVGDRVRVVYRCFPLSDIHPHAERAAQAAEAAALQGRFWEMSHRLFMRQKALRSPDLLQHAEAVGLDPEQFARDLQGEPVAARVRQDRRGGERSGVSGTPTFFLNGERFAPKFNLPGLAEALQQELEARG